MYPSTTRTSAVTLLLDVQYITMVYYQLVSNTPSMKDVMLAPEVLAENIMFLLPLYVNQDFESLNMCMSNLLNVTCNLQLEHGGGKELDPDDYYVDFTNVLSTVLSRVAFMLININPASIRDLAGRDLIEFETMNSRLVRVLYE